jgi:two-component system, response regulator PdtaR
MQYPVLLERGALPSRLNLIAPFVDRVLAPPRDRPPVTAPADEAGPNDSPKPSTCIMIVEDDFLIAMQMEDALRQAGFEVVLASSGEEALAIARERKPTLTVMDIRLAGAMDGVDAALALFRTHALRSIFATAHSDPDIRARAAPAQPAGWLVKPYTMPSLVSAVRYALTGNNPQRS